MKLLLHHLSCAAAAAFAATVAPFTSPAKTPAPDVAPTVIMPRPLPPLPPRPVITVADLRADEKPVAVEQARSVVGENAFFSRVRTTFTFTNPNARSMSGEFEFPIPDGAFVCGYSLEIDGVMVPGTVCEKEKARVAFENEVRKGIDPGLVEHVKGNVWKTRIFPLAPNKPRRAEIDVIEPKQSPDCEKPVCERDGDDVFVATLSAEGEAKSIGESIASFSKGAILWDASGSAEVQSATWRTRLESLPETGDWRLVTFSNEPEESTHTTRASLLAAIDAVTYDGGTDIAKAVDCAKKAGCGAVLLFSDEMDTLGIDAPRYDDMPGLVVASRPDAPPRRVKVRRLAQGEAAPEGAEIAEGSILATVWAAERIADLSSQADARKDEFLALGRRYGVASPVTSLIVLETLEQYLTHKIEPPAAMPFHDEWVRRRKADDDAISAKKDKTQHEAALLALWEERIKWWNDPKPKVDTPKSGLFERTVNSISRAASRVANAAMPTLGATASSRRAEALASDSAWEDHDASHSVAAAAAAPEESAHEMRRSAGFGERRKSAESAAPGSAGSGTAPSVRLAPWKADAPYMKEIEDAAKDGTAAAYAAYLKMRKEYGRSPAFFMDAASAFFAMKEPEARPLAVRILSNMAEFKLEDAKVWRTMGWKMREAGCMDEAVVCFRKALKLRGEEGQSRRDLALVLSERGKAAKAAADLSEAMALHEEAAFGTTERRSGRRSNDMQVSIVALEELNGLISWCERENIAAKPPELDPAFRRDMPVKLRIVLSWNADETDIDLHILEPNGEEAYYGHRRTSSGGFVSEDVTTGYGPEEYLKKDMESGKYEVLSNYFASHQTALTGPATVTATVYTDWGTSAEKMQIMTLRLDKPKDRHLIGSIDL